MFYWIGKHEVISVEKSFPERSELPDGFDGALDAAMKKILNESIDWDTMSVKTDRVGKEPVLRKTLGQPWSYRFARVGETRMLSLHLDHEAHNEVIRVLSVGLHLRFEGKRGDNLSFFVPPAARRKE